MTATKGQEGTRPLHVIVVDDDVDMLALLRATIEKELDGQACVQSAADPETACAHLESGLIDIVVTDLQMPGMSGLELLRYAKRRNAWTQVVMVTGHSNTEALTAAMDAGASDYLVKPVEAAELRRVLAEATARHHRWRRSLARTLVSAAAR